MTRWKLGLVGLTLTVSGLIGCTQRLYVSEVDNQHYAKMGLDLGVQNLENDPTAAITPHRYGDIPEPPTVEYATRERRNMTLAEAIAISLEQGNTGSQSALFPGIGNDNIQASPRGGTFSDSIKVLALDPAIAGADIEASLSKFDARWQTSLVWNKLDSGQASVFSTNENNATFDTRIIKPLATGGAVQMSFGGYDNTPFYQQFSDGVNPGATLNSFYKPHLEFRIDQPLLKDYGIEFNQLASNHRLGQQGGRVEGVLITRLRHDGAKADFEKNVNFMILNVEYAYWNLWYSYGALEARDQALADALELYTVMKSRLDAGGVGDVQNQIRPQDVQRIKAQMEGFRAQRFQALGTVFENERQLRSLLGMKYDGTRLVPVDEPNKAPFSPNWREAVDEAMVNRPELTLARQDLKFRQFDLMIQKNSLKPTLDLSANYDIGGIGRTLGGSLNEPGVDPAGNPIASPHNALASLATNKFNSWGIGLTYVVPLGYRDAHSAVRVSRLNLYRSYASMLDSERKVVDQLRVNYSRLSEYQYTLQAQLAQFLAAKSQYDILQQRREIDIPLTVNLESSLNAQQTRAAALTAYYRAIADYNNTWAGWQFAKGTIMQYDNVSIADGPLPQAAQIRAVDHLRERSRALKIRERANDEVAPTGAFPTDLSAFPGAMPPGTVYDAAPPVSGAMRPDPARIPSVPAQDLPAFGAAASRPGVIPPAAQSSMPK